MNKNGAKKRKPLWLMIVIAFCLLIVAAAWVPSIYSWGFTDRGECRKEKGFFRKLVCGTWATYEGYAMTLRSLPSDEEMIANFQKHRADFERLVHIYREDLSVPTKFYYLEPTPEVKTIMDRVNIAWVGGDGVLWIPPDPYSTEPDFLRKKATLQIVMYSPERRGFAGVIFSYAHKKVWSLNYGLFLHKRYYYIPVVPRVKDGRLIRPAHILDGGPRIVQTLNETPYFQNFDCAYREIEPHWYIGMCQGR